MAAVKPLLMSILNLLFISSRVQIEFVSHTLRVGELNKNRLINVFPELALIKFARLWRSACKP
jgi:hypothetical protein